MKQKFHELGDSISNMNIKQFELEFFIDEYSLFRGGYNLVSLNCGKLLSIIKNDPEVLSGLSEDEINCLYNYVEIVTSFSNLGSDAIDKLEEFNVFNGDPTNSLKNITDLLIKYFLY